MYPYTKFGFNLWRLREARGQTSKSVADALGVPQKDYQAVEMGRVLPTDRQLPLIAELLQEKISTLQSWIQSVDRPVTPGKMSPQTDAYLDAFDAQVDTLKNRHRHVTGHALSTAQIKAIAELKRQIPKIIDLPVLPMNFILITDALLSVEAQNYEFLHEYKDFITKGESLAGFLSRDLYYGPFGFYAANLLYFADKPFGNLQACFERLTFAQFAEIFTLACLQNGIYEMENDIPRLQQHVDFTSLACLFVREIAKECGPTATQEVDFDRLYQACLLQGLGQYVLFEKLKPAILGPQTEYADSDDDNVKSDLDTQLFREILWSLHPAISAILGANWRFDDAVLQTLLTHHDHPAIRVSANTALLKIVNFFVDKDFPKITKADLDDLLKAYPQVPLTSQVLHKACLRLTEIKSDLFERSSTLLGHYHDTSLKTAPDRKGPHIAPENDLKTPLKRGDFRFDPQFQMVLKNTAHTHYENLLLRLILPRAGETLKAATERQTAFHLSLQYLLTKNWDDVAKAAQMSKDEISFRMKSRKTGKAT